MEQKRLCPFCIGELPPAATVCPHCGKILEGCNPAGCLPVGTVLAGRYTVGEMRSLDGEGVLYSGVENLGGFRVTIKEYLPVTLSAERGADCILRPKQGSEVLFKTTRMDFADQYRAVQRITPASGQEAEMDEVHQVVNLGRAARNLSNLKNRQPLQALYTDANSGLGQLYTDIIKQELNVKDVQFLTDMSQFTAYTFKPQLKLLGKKLGKRLNDARQALQELDGSEAKKELDATGVLKLSLPDGDIELTAEELLIETAQKEGYTSVSDRGVTVVLDTALTEELIREGFVREIISKLQTMRKEAGFNVTDHIQVYCQGSGKVQQVLEENQEAILHDVLGDACHFDTLEGYTAQQDVNGETVTFGVKRV